LELKKLELWVKSVLQCAQALAVKSLAKHIFAPVTFGSNIMQCVGHPLTVLSQFLVETRRRSSGFDSLNVGHSKIDS
jgi:hypothetical protein